MLQGFVIFGRDITKIPCLRSSFLYGIGSGFAGGLTCFMLTSNVPKANNWAMGSYILGTIVCWSKCRYDYFQSKHEMLKLQTAIERKLIYEGSVIEQEVEREQNFNLKTV